MLRAALIVLAAAGAAVTPLKWSKKTASSEVSLTLPAAVRHVPVLGDRLYRGEVKVLQKFARDAADPKDGQASVPKQFRHGAWEMVVNYEPALETTRLISLYREAYEDTQGAHPNHQSGGVVFDKAANTNLHPLDLLKPAVNLAPLDKALCDAARAAKRARQEGPWNEKADTNFSCPTWRGLRGEGGKLLEGSSPPQIALAPGDVPGKAAGLDFIYSPYQIGAYVEGGFDVVVPLSVFQGALKPDYLGEFAGRPRPNKRMDG